MGWTCPENGNIIKLQKVLAMESTRENEKGQTKDDMEEDYRGRVKGYGNDLG